MQKQILAIPILSISLSIGISQAEEFKQSPEIEQQISAIKSELQSEQLKDYNQQVESQRDFIENWQAYGRDVQENRKTEERVMALKKQLQELEIQKQKLVDQKYSNTSRDQ